MASPVHTELSSPAALLLWRAKEEGTTVITPDAYGGSELNQERKRLPDKMAVTRPHYIYRFATTINNTFLMGTVL